MTHFNRRFHVAYIGAAGAVLMCAAAAAAAAPDYTEKGFLEAAYSNCANTQNRRVEACDCEQKLIRDRVIPEDKEMAYYYWVDKEKYVEKFKARTQADPEWPKGFSERFANIQALLTAACGA